MLLLLIVEINVMCLLCELFYAKMKYQKYKYEYVVAYIIQYVLYILIHYNSYSIFI